MEYTPNKWKKHLTLVQFGLKTEEELNNEIKRYKKSDTLKLIDDLHRQFEDDSKNSAYILSLIPSTDCFKLPNYVIEDEKDIDQIIEIVKSSKNQFSEIWYCEKEKRDGIDNVIGRISLQTGISYHNVTEHKIEQVWSINHRDIEKYTLDKAINYLIATRDGWNRRYNIDRINIVNSKDKTTIMNDFICAIINIERNREKIENMLEHLRKVNIPEITLEYMLTIDKFKFIDWDTSNDKKVIDSIFKENLERG